MHTYFYGDIICTQWWIFCDVLLHSDMTCIILLDELFNLYQSSN